MFKKLCPSKKKMSSSLADRKQIAPPLPVVARNGSVSTTDESDSASGDSLEGLMQLTVNLPDKRIVSMSVEKRMPMMDLLVHVTTANKIPPGGHIIKIVNDEENGFLSYKPSTPIGSLTSSVIFIVPKKNLNEQPLKRELVKSTQPFEPTFRLQVHLPRQQLLVLRVSQQTKLSSIHQMVCNQKGFDSSRYYLQHPSNPDIVLDYNLCLADYSLNEINMVSRYSQTNNNVLTNENFIIPKELEDKKRKSLFGMFRRHKTHSTDLNSTDKINKNAIPVHNEDFTKSSSSRPLSACASQAKVIKKRPAPPPPASKSSGRTERPPPPPPLHSKSTTSVEVIHSRQSSDSSGYHDSSVLGDSPEGLAPDISENETEHPKSSSAKYLTMPTSSTHTDASKSKGPTNLTTTLSASNSSITTGLKKRRAPLPPSRSTSPITNGNQEKTNENTMTKNGSEPPLPSFVSYPVSCQSKGDDPANLSPPSSPLISKEIPDVCMKDQNGLERAEHPSECSVIVSSVPSHIEKIDLPGDGDSPGSSSPDDNPDNACLPSHLGTEDTETSEFQPSSFVETKGLHDLHDNHPSSLPCVVADVVTHKMNSPAVTSPSESDIPPSSIVNVAPSSLLNPCVELNALARDTLLENSEISQQNVTHDKIGFNDSKNSINLRDAVINGDSALHTEEHIEEKEQGDHNYIEKENDETRHLPLDNKEHKGFMNDIEAEELEERISLSSLSSDEDDIISSFKDVITDIQEDIIKNDSLSSGAKEDEAKQVDFQLNERPISSEIGKTSKQQEIDNGHSSPSSDEHKLSGSEQMKINITNKNAVIRSISSGSGSETKGKLKISESFQEPSTNERKQAKVRYRRPLMNFSISTYKPRTDVTTVQEVNLVKSESFSNNLNNETVTDKPKATRSSSFEGRFSDQSNYQPQITESSRNTILTVNAGQNTKRNNSYTTSHSKVEDITDETGINGVHFLNTKAASMVDLSQDEESKLRRTKSEFVVSPMQDNIAEIDQPEYLQLQHEYLKLQNKLLYWQQQLLSNQNLLQRQHILPSDVFQLSPEMLSLPHVENELDYSTPAVKASTFPKQSDKSKHDHHFADLPRVASLHQELNKNDMKSSRPVSMDVTHMHHETSTVNPLSEKDTVWPFSRRDGQSGTLSHQSKKSAKDTKHNPEFRGINGDETSIKSNEPSSHICSKHNFDYAKETVGVLPHGESEQVPNCKIIENKVILKKIEESSAGSSVDSLPSVKERIKLMEHCYVKDANKRETEPNIKIEQTGDPDDIHQRKNSLTSSKNVLGDKSEPNNLPFPVYKSVTDFNSHSNRYDKKHHSSGGRKFRRQRVDVTDEYGDNHSDGFSKRLPFVVGVWENDKVNSEPLDSNCSTFMKIQPQKTQEIVHNKKKITENGSRQITATFKEPVAISNKNTSKEAKKTENSPNLGVKPVSEEIVMKRHKSSVKINGVQENNIHKDGIVTIHIKDSSLPCQSSSGKQSSKGTTPRRIGNRSGKHSVTQTNPRDTLLEAIQNFGGVKNLKRVPKEEPTHSVRFT